MLTIESEFTIAIYALYAIDCVHDLDQLVSSDTGMLTTLSFCGAINMLVLLPVLLLTGYLPAFWLIPASIALFTQLGQSFELYREGAFWRRERPGDFWPQFISLLLNPLAALRSGDVLLRGLVGTGMRKTPPF